MSQLITATRAKYIKLGIGGCWENLCLSDGTLRLGYNEVPHELGLSDQAGLRMHYIQRGVAANAATSHARQILDFYQAEVDTLWISFSRGFLWWCRTDSPVEFLGHNEVEYPDGSRLRRTVEGWKNRSVAGKELRLSELPGYLTQTSRYQGTICRIGDSAFEYLMRRINDQDLPEAYAAKTARHELAENIKKLIKKLTPQDFELFIDILFSKSGWVRISPLGGTVADIDMELVMPLTDERAIVQVKSSTNRAQLRDYEDRLGQYDAARIFYVYHTSGESLHSDNPKLCLLGLDKLASATVKAGLSDWLIDRV